MAATEPHPKPTFLWQALLIVLPVVTLAAVGFFSLRQDKILAEHEATERAQAIADDLLPKIWAALSALGNSGQSASRVFQVDDTGRLVFPPPAAPIPNPKPFDLAELTDEQKHLWEVAQSAEADQPDLDLAAAARTYRAFIDSKPPESFSAAAHYSLGLLLGKEEEYQLAAEIFAAVLERYPQATGESGLPLKPLAQLKLLQLEADQPSLARQKSFASLDAFCSEAVDHPTPLTPYLLSMSLQPARSLGLESHCQAWQSLWDEQQVSRALFSAGSTHIRTNARLPLFWFDTADNRKPPSVRVPTGAIPFDSQAWLAIRSDDGESNFGSTNGFDLTQSGPGSLPDETPSSHLFVRCTESDVGSKLRAVVKGMQIPDYFGVGIELAGRRLACFNDGLRLWSEVGYFGRGGGGLKTERSGDLATQILASATQKEQGAELLRVNVYLTSASTLFKRQSTRTFWFGLLIAASAAAALLGLLTAWRVFHRQQQLSEMKSNFVSSVSHELRAPIASVRLMAESLERGKIPEATKQQDYFRFIGQECRRLSSLIENVLDFSRIERGRKQYDLEPTDLVALVRQTVGLMETYAAEKPVTLKLSLEHLQPGTGALELSIDARAMQQALVNLIDNALKHSPKGGTVTIGLQTQAEPSPEKTEPSSRITHHASRILLWVEDNGDGIPAEEHEKIFQRFYRRGSELRRETQGVGIGLSIVKHIVEAHGGRVRVRSAVGQGSRFTIELPIKNDE